MDEGQEYQWHIELEDMWTRLSWVLNNIDDSSKSVLVRHQIEQVRSRLTELCELTKGESK